MRLGAEALLLLLALALYLFDSAWLLARDEAVLIRAGRAGRGGGGRWFARFGADRWRLAGREPFVPNPFTPQRPLFRLRWRFERVAPGGPAARPVEVPAGIDTFAPFVVIAAVCWFVLLPAALFVPLGTAVSLAVVALIYLNSVAALALVVRRRHALRIAPRALALLAFECLVCPPLAINLVRKLCALQGVTEDFCAAATRLLAPAELAASHAGCRARLEEAIDAQAEDSPRMQALLAARVRFPRDAD